MHSQVAYRSVTSGDTNKIVFLLVPGFPFPVSGACSAQFIDHSCAQSASRVRTYCSLSSKLASTFLSEHGLNRFRRGLA